MSCHSEELGYNETVCQWMTIYIQREREREREREKINFLYPDLNFLFYRDVSEF